MSSSSRRNTWTHRVFTSFHGPDVRKAFLSHLRKQFNYNGISMFDDQGIERSQTIAPSLTHAIHESRISIVVLSKNYASSTWCLDELVDILKCKEDMGQIVMTIFYGVDPAHVRKQTGDFGKVFDETCYRKTEEERRNWSQALYTVSNIAGEHFLNWDNESKMIEKIARDVSNKLNATISRDFEDMVGVEAHLEKIQSLLHLEYEDGAMIVGIYGPAGIGKTTIARALHSRYSSSFQLTCFMENIRGICKSGLDDYGLKLCLQEQLLSKILNQNGMRIYHLGAIPDRLCDQKVLIILDDVDGFNQLEALANDPNWFGPGSRIVITTEDQELLEQHDISNIYHVDFPTKEEARKIFCRYAFKQSLPPLGFEELSERVTELCSNLPLGLCITGSSLCGKSKNDWEAILHRLENSLDRKIEGVLRVGYDNLHKKDQLLFLLIAFFFNNEEDDHVMAMLAEDNLDVRLGLKTLAYKSLIQISSRGNIVMHKLLQQMGKQVVERQEPWKRQVLIDTDEICDVLENDFGSRSVTGISLDVSTISGGMYINAGAFKRMHNLRFLNIYRTRVDTNDRVHVPEDIDFPPRLRLLHWEVYPGKCLPRTIRPEYLVELNLRQNCLKKLWEGIQPLTNLKKMDLVCSFKLKELPDLSNATNLKRLDMSSCFSLVEIPSSFENLHKLDWLGMGLCVNLQVVPSCFNLASLKELHMLDCRRLRKIPDISRNITSLIIADTMLEEVPESIRLWSRLQTLNVYGSGNTLPVLAEAFQKGNGVDIERIPDWIKDLKTLKFFHICGCPKLASLPELPSSLRGLLVETCESLKTVSFSFDSPIEYLYFHNCFKLGEEACRVITQHSLHTCLPGRNIPAEFDHRAIGSSLNIRLDFYRFRTCVVLSPKPHTEIDYPQFWCRIRINGCPTDRCTEMIACRFQTEHLFICDFELVDEDGWLDQNNEILFEFSTTSRFIDITECGLQIFRDESIRSLSYESISEQVSEDDTSQGSSESRSEQVSDGSNAPRVKVFQGYTLSLILIFLFLLSFISITVLEIVVSMISFLLRFLTD